MLTYRIFRSTLNLPKRTPFKFPRRELATVQLSHASYDTSSDPDLAPMLVHHGLFGSKTNWNSLCKAYHAKTRRRIFAVDARNHGDSPHTPEHTYPHLVADLRAFLAQYDVDRVVLLGHSMGGRAVMHFALKYPNVVERMIVADISPVRNSPNLTTMPGLFKIVQDVELPENVTMSAARSRVDESLAESIDDKDLRSFLLTNLTQRSDGRFAWRINMSALLNNFDEMARFPDVEGVTYDKPVLFVGGGDSDYIKESDHPGILKFFPNAEFHYIEGAGHWVHSEKPREFLERTVEFLNKS